MAALYHTDRLVDVAVSCLRKGRVVSTDLLAKLQAHGIDTNYLTTTYEPVQDYDYGFETEETTHG